METVELPHCYPIAPKLPNLLAPMPDLKGSLEDVDNHATLLFLNIPAKHSEDQSAQYVAIHCSNETWTMTFSYQ